jgi:probable addiction module antidote protein
LVEIRHYVTRAGKDLFDDWFSQLADARSQARIVTRINRLALGNFGDCKRLRQGLCELWIDWGARLPGLLRNVKQNLCPATVRRRQTKTVFGYRSGARVSGLQGKDSNPMKRKASISHDEAIVRRLRRHPDSAAEYLKSALEEDDDPRVLLIALRHLALAQGIAKVAKAARIERESLYRALSARGNPRLSTLFAVSKAIGLRLTVKAA